MGVKLPLSSDSTKAGSLYCTKKYNSEVTEGSLAVGVRRFVSGLRHLGESRQNDRQRRELESRLGAGLSRDFDVDVQMQGNVGQVGDVGVGFDHVMGDGMYVDGDLGESTLQL